LVPFDYTLTNALGTAARYHWRAGTERAWPGLPDSGVIQLAAHETAPLQVGVAIPDTAENGPVTLTLVTWLDGHPLVADTCSTEIRDPGTATLLDLASGPELTSRGVRIVWYAAAPLGEGAVFRQHGTGPWSDFARVTQSGNGQFAFEDTTLIAGHTYAYRLRVIESGEPLWSGEVRVSVPASGLFVLGTRPSPAGGRWSAVFGLPEYGRVTLRLIDLAGRQMRSLEVDGAPGINVLDMGEVSLPSGLYWLRISQNGRHASGRVAVLK